MTDMPDHIWAFDFEDTPGPIWRDSDDFGGEEYIRADLTPQWQPIELAPKDGTRIMLWRGRPKLGVWAEMVIAEWFNGEWVWPDPRDNPSTHEGWTEDEMSDGYADSKNFTHWIPLPAPPAELPGNAPMEKWNGAFDIPYPDREDGW